MADISVIKMPDNSSYNIKDAAARESIAALPTDIQINGSSIVNNGIANIPIGRNKLGALYVDSNGSYGVCVNSTDGRLLINAATQSVIKSGTEGYKPIVAVHQHESVYYALAKLAGADMTSVMGETVGVYPEAQKAAIQNMFGITDLISTEESSTATAAHTVNSTFMMNGKLHRATVAIAIGDAVEVGTNCEVVKADEVFVKNTEYASIGNYGLVKIGNEGINVSSQGNLRTVPAGDSSIKGGTVNYNPIVPLSQHLSVFYGLSKVAGVDLASETVTVGTYPETSKTAIRTLIGAAPSEVIAVQDTQPTNIDTKVWMMETPPESVEVPTMEDLAGYVQKTDIANNTTPGLVIVRYQSDGLFMDNNNRLNIAAASDSALKAGSSNYRPITPMNQHKSVFYGLSKLAGVDLASGSDTVGIYPDIALQAIQKMLGMANLLGYYEMDTTADQAYAVNELFIFNGKLYKATAAIAIGDTISPGTKAGNNCVPALATDVFVKKTDYALNNGDYGLVKVTSGSYGITRANDGYLMVSSATEAHLKAGNTSNRPVVPNNQHISVFYGLSKLAGVDLASGTDTLGVYPQTAKTAIQTMLGIEANVPLIETVSGTTPSITGMPNVRYVCGEVSTISITPPASGSIVVRFESGSTATTLTVPNTVKWPAWFDATSLDADTIYEIIITDGAYGGVMSWAA